MVFVPSIEIKNVPDEVHRVLRRRAAEAGQSLQAYLLTLLVEQASRPTLDEALGRVSGRAGGSLPLAYAAQAVRAERDTSDCVRRVGAR
jgi:antitoxin FitA